jgi:cell division protein FtsI/penicillin-binding protein 2
MWSKGTASKLYSKDFSMAGKTGTAAVNYAKMVEQVNIMLPRSLVISLLISQNIHV